MVMTGPSSIMAMELGQRTCKFAFSPGWAVSPASTRCPAATSDIRLSRKVDSSAGTWLSRPGQTSLRRIAMTANRPTVPSHTGAGNGIILPAGSDVWSGSHTSIAVKYI